MCVQNCTQYAHINTSKHTPDRWHTETHVYINAATHLHTYTPHAHIQRDHKEQLKFLFDDSRNTKLSRHFERYFSSFSQNQTYFLSYKLVFTHLDTYKESFWKIYNFTQKLVHRFLWHFYFFNYFLYFLRISLHHFSLLSPTSISPICPSFSLKLMVWYFHL